MRSQETVRNDTKKHEPTTSPIQTRTESNDHPCSGRSSLGNAGSPSTSFISDSTSSRISNPHPPMPKPATKQSSPPTSKARPSVRFSKEPIILNKDEEPPLETRPPSRPPPPVPMNQGPMLSAVDLKWGKLFDDKGEPTERLGQVLRGIANYLVCHLTKYLYKSLKLMTPRFLSTVLATRLSSHPRSSGSFITNTSSNQRHSRFSVCIISIHRHCSSNMIRNIRLSSTWSSR
jgi:hypothetical protein